MESDEIALLREMAQRYTGDVATQQVSVPPP
jgi:hypothetical protein